jgi:hypothetical protein
MSLTAAELLKGIGERLPPEIWARYRDLTAKRRSDEISEAEYGELLDLTNRIEEWNARRLAHAQQLAELERIPLRELMRRLDSVD